MTSDRTLQVIESNEHVNIIIKSEEYEFVYKTSINDMKYYYIENNGIYFEFMLLFGLFEEDKKYYLKICRNEINANIEITLKEYNQYVEEFKKFKILHEMLSDEDNIVEKYKNDTTELTCEELIILSEYPKLFKYSGDNLRFDELFKNENLIELDENIIIKILEMMINIEEEFSADTLINVLKHSNKVRNWVFEKYETLKSIICYLINTFYFFD